MTHSITIDFEDEKDFNKKVEQIKKDLAEKKTKENKKNLIDELWSSFDTKYDLLEMKLKVVVKEEFEYSHYISKNNFVELFNNCHESELQDCKHRRLKDNCSITDILDDRDLLIEYIYENKNVFKEGKFEEQNVSKRKTISIDVFDLNGKILANIL